MNQFLRGFNFSDMLEPILNAYGFTISSTKIESLSGGLINNTWKITVANSDYVLQKINNAVFKQPEKIAHNISLAAAYLKQNAPNYTFISPLEDKNGAQMCFFEGLGYFRLFPFVANSHSKNVVETPEQAYQAAAQFGKFTHLLSGLSLQKLKTTIPHFHDLNLRYRQFLAALKTGNSARIAESADLIAALFQHADIVKQHKILLKNPDFKRRATHHDTKISNVLFDAADTALCVIDFDTLMPGYFISDVGDMMRTYLSPASEEEQDFDKIGIRPDFYKAIVQGYSDEMKSELTTTEKQAFVFSGKFLIYMQALRFLTDYLNNDVYYGSKYPKHNFMRAKNQMILLKRFIEAKV
jgi:Ser/Thr protein kinase RdoA (MazF antagonist)